MSNTVTRRSALRLLALMLFLTSASLEICAQEQVQVIPQPRQITVGPTRFQITGSTRLALVDPNSTDDRFAAEDFASDMREVAQLTFKISKGRSSKSILIGKLELPAIKDSLRRSGFTAPSDLDREGYVLVVTEREVIIAGASEAGTFYGLQTLKQLVRGEGSNAFIPAVQIVDWPAMRWRGVSDDISRGPVPTLDYIKRQLRTFAAFKLNMHSFYMEHTFASSSHPLIGPEGGSLTPDEIKELVAYARRHHIELVPEQQTFGHLHKALKLEKYNVLAEVPYGDVLSPQREASYALIADWYRELDPLFPGKFFHIGADETFELGEGQSREAVRQRGVGQVYFDHLRRVRELLQPYKRELMFWGDIALNHPELIGSIPKDLIVMNWDYAARDDFGPRIKPFKDAGLRQFVCPGVQNWNQIFPNLNNARKNIVNFVRDGQAAGAIGMMNTTWDDDGDALFETTWYGIVLGAAAAWENKPVDVEALDRKFDWAFFRNDGDHFMQALHELGDVNSRLGIGSSNELFWRYPFDGRFLNEVRSKFSQLREIRIRVELADEMLLKESKRARRNGSMIPAMRLAAQRFDHLGHRMLMMEKFSQEYWDAYLNLGDRQKVGRLRNYWGNIYNWLREMAEEMTILREAYRRQWLAENRPYWLDSVIARYDQSINMWLTKSKELQEAVRNYQHTSILPDPESFGLGPRPQRAPGVR